MTTLIAVLVALVQLVVGLIVAFWAVSWSIRLFDRIFGSVNLIAEMRDGNIAASVLVSGIVLAVVFIIQAAVSGITSALAPGLNITGILMALLAGLIQLVIGIILAVLVVRLALGIFDRVFAGFDLNEQIRVKNVAVALLAAVILVAFASIIQASIAGIAGSIGAALPLNGAAF